MSDSNPGFADEYLEKMINIKVPVPQLSDESSTKLLAWELPDTDQGEVALVVQMWGGVKAALYPFRYFLLMLCVVILGMGFGFFLDSLTRSEPKPTSPQQTIATWNNIEINQLSIVGGTPNLTLRVQENAVATSSGNTASALELSLSATEEDLKKGIVIGKLGDAKTSASWILKSKVASAAGAESDQNASEMASSSHATKFRIGQQDSAYGDYWLPLLVGVLLVLGAVVYTMKMPMRRPKDSANFKKALNIWKPWILLNRQTPRAIKRYLNRVRYIAMRFRVEPEPQSIGVGNALLRLFRKQSVIEKSAHTPDEQFEANLVALSAIQAVDTPWAANVFDIASIQPQDLQDLVKNKFGEPAASSKKADDLVQQLAEAIEAHREEFGDGVAGYSEKFKKMLADIQVK